MDRELRMTASWGPLLEPLDPEPEWIAALVQRYAEPHRRYHGVSHIDALARSFEAVAAGPGWEQPAEVALAILFHDAVYQPGQADNEAQSALLAREWLAKGAAVDVDRIAAMILATANHGAAQVEGDRDLGHFLDADVAILGAPAPIYDRYAQAVFDEYAPVVPAAVYEAGRAAFLRGQLSRGAIFHTAFFRGRYEARARENLGRELVGA